MELRHLLTIHFLCFFTPFLSRLPPEPGRPPLKNIQACLEVTTYYLLLTPYFLLLLLPGVSSGLHLFCHG